MHLTAQAAVNMKKTFRGIFFAKKNVAIKQKIWREHLTSVGLAINAGQIKI